MNALKKAIAEGTHIRGLHLTFPAPGVIELMKLASIDYVYLDGEHGAFEARDLEACCIAAERHGITAIARVPDPGPATIVHFLDRGIRGIVAPHVDSVADARRVVDAAYYGPKGSRSFGGSRPLFVAGIPDKPAHMARENDEVCVSIMIETKGALATAGEIAALEGVDYMSFGLMDLAQSLGHPGDPGAAEVRAAVAEASTRIRSAGKPVREDFVTVGWVNDILLAGAERVFGSKR
jgi:2-keto-3-deoxy-L-rhamnonate aldolase RhmA